MRRMRKSTKRRILYVTGLLLLQAFLLVGGMCYAEHRSERKYVSSVKEKEERIKNAERGVFITTREVLPGEAFTEENTEYVQLLSEQDQHLLATGVDGVCAVAGLPAGKMIYITDCCDRSPSETEKECVFYEIGNVEYFSDFAMVDVRIRYGNGENYCVLKGKRLSKQTEDADGCSFFLTEEEQLLMSGAVYDADTYRGTSLYLVGTGQTIQEEGTSRFLPPGQILLQLKNTEDAEPEKYRDDTNQRQELEERLALHENQRLSGLR